MKKSVLIIDKDPFILLAFKRILFKEKINVLSASNIEQVALRHKGKKPMLVLLDLDYKTKQVNSIGRIKMLFPKVPIIAFTAYNNIFTQDMVFEMGADAFLTKPFNIPSMIQKINQLINIKPL